MPPKSDSLSDKEKAYLDLKSFWTLKKNGHNLLVRRDGLFVRKCTKGFNRFWWDDKADHPFAEWLQAEGFLREIEAEISGDYRAVIEYLDDAFPIDENGHSNMVEEVFLSDEKGSIWTEYRYGIRRLLVRSDKLLVTNSDNNSCFSKGVAPDGIRRLDIKSVVSKDRLQIANLLDEKFPLK